MPLSPTPTPIRKLITPSPTSTPQPSATRTPVPTYTPATPSQLRIAALALPEWTINKTDLMIDQISSHLIAIQNNPEYDSVPGRSIYMKQFLYLAFAEQEALLRFPDASQADTWRWDVCYNLALSYEYSEAADAPELPCYAKLIEDGLNSGQTNLSNLPHWFRAHESRFPFKITSQISPQGYASSHIITLEDNALLWLLEKDGKFQATGLMSSMFFFRETGARFQSIDLTGDQFPELVSYFHRAYCCGSFSFQFIYDLSSGTPRQLNFRSLDGTHSNVASEYDSDITALSNETAPGLLFKSHYGNPLDQPCHLRQYDKYFWRNNEFELVETWYKIEPPEEYEDQNLCKFAMDTPTSQDETNIVAQAIRQVRGAHMPGFRQIIPFRLGEYYARLGNYEKAYRFFSSVATAPSSSESQPEWTKAAKTILERYKAANDFYLACAKVQQCDSHSAVQQAIENIKPDLFPTAGEILQMLGVPIKDSGIFDFDVDGSAEQWIVVQHPGKNEREFWVVVKGDQKIAALFVANVPSARLDMHRFEVRDGEPIIELKTSTGKILFSLQKLQFTAQPYILRTSTSSISDDETGQNDKNTFWEQSINRAANMLLAGSDPAAVKEILLGLQQSKNYDCDTYRCDQLYYFLALAHELTNDQPAAANTYVQLWNEYPDSIYTIMARSKLELAP